MNIWESIRLRCCRDGEPVKVVARDLELAPNTVRKYARSDEPPRSKRRERAGLLDRFQPHIDELLLNTPRITAVRIGRYLRDNVDASLSVEESTLRKYVARRRSLLVPKEAFVRASYTPGGDVQFDFSPVEVRLAGVLVIVQLFAIRLSYSGRFFARAFLRCDQVALFTGLLAGLLAFGGLPRRAIFDNAKIAVTRILRGRNRVENTVFREFCGALALEVHFAAPAKGNEKGGVEGVIGYLQDNFFQPVPAFDSFEDFNAQLAEFCLRDAEREHATHKETIAARFGREQMELRAFPAVLPRACVTKYARVNKFAEVVFQRDIYSVPSRYAYRDATIEVYEDQLRIVVGSESIAQHPRGIGRGERFLDPRHYLDLLQHKHRAAEHALVLADGRIPAALHDLFRHYQDADHATATKRWTKVLALLADHPAEIVAEAVTHALARGTTDPAAIALLLRQRITPVPPALLDPSRLPEGARVGTLSVDLGRYAVLDLAEMNP